MAVVTVLKYLVVVLTMEVNVKQQCNKGVAARDGDNNDRQGDRSKLFGVGGRGGDNEEGQRRRVEEAY